MNWIREKLVAILLIIAMGGIVSVDVIERYTATADAHNFRVYTCNQINGVKISLLEGLNEVAAKQKNPNEFEQAAAPLTKRLTQDNCTNVP